jgi:hypothetical protein
MTLDAGGVEVLQHSIFFKISPQDKGKSSFTL